MTLNTNFSSIAAAINEFEDTNEFTTTNSLVANISGFAAAIAEFEGGERQIETVAVARPTTALGRAITQMKVAQELYAEGYISSTRCNELVRIARTALRHINR